MNAKFAVKGWWNMTKAKNYEEVRSGFLDFMNNYRFKYVLEKADKMTPIEGIVFITLLDMCNFFGIHNLSLIPQEKIGKYTVDFLLIYKPLDNNLISRKIIIECDGHEWHEKTKKQAAHDKERDRYLSKNGYTVLHYTGSEIYNDRHKVWSDIEEMLVPEEHKCAFGYGEEFEKMIKELAK